MDPDTNKDAAPTPPAAPDTTPAPAARPTDAAATADAAVATDAAVAADAATPASDAADPAKSKPAASPIPTQTSTARPRSKAEPAKAARAKATPAKAAPPAATKPSPAKAAPAKPPAAKATPDKAAAPKTAAAKATPAQAPAPAAELAKAASPKKSSRRPRTDTPVELIPPAPTGPSTTDGPQTIAPTEEPSIPTQPQAANSDRAADLAKPGPADLRRTDAWAQLIADPGHAPELLALAAVQTIGPRAHDWAVRIREQYPTATDAAIARLAAKQFTRFGSLGSVFGTVAGSYAPVALIGAAALTHAELILHIAAAYGLDPADETRAAELLILAKVHSDRADAEAALATAKQPAYDEGGGITDAVWRLGRMAAAQTGGWTAVRVVNRVFPGASLLAATLASRASADGVAHRALRYYSRHSIQAAKD
jgi:hypothetical protein